MSEGWGDERSCNRCGHPAGYHGTTFCVVRTGAPPNRECDCAGWHARRAPATASIEHRSEAQARPADAALREDALANHLLALDGIMLNAIRYRAAVGHGQSVEDRAWLLRYIDRTALAQQPTAAEGEG